jgi:hypothetical protein
LKTIVLRLVGVLGMTIAGFGVYYCGSVSESDHVTFMRLDPMALEAAFGAKKPVVIYVTSPNDPACKAQDDGALEDPKVIAALAPFVRFKVVTGSYEGMRGAAMAEQMGAELNAPALPMFQFMVPPGVQTATLAGAQTADQLIAAATKTQNSIAVK